MRGDEFMGAVPLTLAARMDVRASGGYSPEDEACVPYHDSIPSSDGTAPVSETAKAPRIDLGKVEIVDAPDSHAAAGKAVALVREGRAEILMKGSLHTDELMGAVVSREGGLRTAGRRISHAFIMDVPT